MISKVTMPNVEILDIDKKGFQKVILRSLTKVAEQGETLGNRLVRETYNMTRADVDKAISVRWASISQLQVNINIKGRRLPRIMFAPNQRLGRASGVILRIKKGGRTFAKDAFIAKMRTGPVGVFKRTPGKFMQGRKNRQAIAETYTISVAEMFGSQAIVDAVEQKMIEAFPAVLDNQLQFYLSSG